MYLQTPFLRRVASAGYVRLISLLIAFSILALSSLSHAAAPSAAQLDQARIAGLAWILSHQNGDGSWQSANGSNFQPTTAALAALTNAGITNGYAYTAAVTYIQNTEPPSVDSLSRQILALNSAGIVVVPHVTQLAEWQNGNNAWGAYKSYGGSLPDTALAVNALFQTQSLNQTNIYYTICSGSLAYAQNTDGSYPYGISGSGASAVQASGALLPTLYAVLALKNIQTLGAYSDCTKGIVTTRFTFSTMQTNAINWILTKQSATDGGFGDYGQSTVFETALAYQVLKTISPTTYATALGNASGFLIAQQGANGNWGNDPLSAALALQTLPTLAPGTLTDTNKNGVPDVVESFLGYNTTAANRVFAVGNGQAVSGVTTSQLIFTGTQFTPFNHNLANNGGTAPYNWTIVSGILPDGLSLNSANGVVSGTPMTAGTFNFNFSVTDAAGVATAVAAQITIAAVDTYDNDIPFLPPWAMLLMALVIAGLMYKQYMQRDFTI